MEAIEHLIEELSQEVRELNLEGLARMEILRDDHQGRFSASDFHRLMTYEDKLSVFPSGAMTYVMEKVAEEETDSCDFGSSYESYEMRRGKEKEPEAAKRFTKETGIKLNLTGEDQEFITYHGKFHSLRDHVGGTPDGEIDQDIGIEIKCQNSENHLNYILNVNKKNFKKEVKKFYWQMQGYMFLTGKKSWFFVSYDDRIKDPSRQIFIVRIDRNEEDIAKLTFRLREAVRIKKQLLKKLQNRNTCKRLKQETKHIKASI